MKNQIKHSMTTTPSETCPVIFKGRRFACAPFVVEMKWPFLVEAVWCGTQSPTGRWGSLWLSFRCRCWCAVSRMEGENSIRRRDQVGTDSRQGGGQLLLCLQIPNPRYLFSVCISLPWINYRIGQGPLLHWWYPHPMNENSNIVNHGSDSYIIK